LEHDLTNPHPTTEARTDMKMNDLAAALVQTPRTANIHLWSGTGEGPTPQGAFDAALIDGGAANCKRLRESSLIAPNSRIVCAKPNAAPHGNGQRLFVVISKMQQSRPGRHAHAGIGWVLAALLVTMRPVRAKTKWLRIDSTSQSAGFMALPALIVGRSRASHGVGATASPQLAGVGGDDDRAHRQAVAAPRGERGLNRAVHRIAQ